MPFQDLTRAGYRPAGTSSGPALEGILRGIEEFLPAYKDSTERKAKAEKRKIDAYISYRKAGYSESEATKAANRGGFPAGDTLKDLDREKTEAGIDATKARAEYYRSRTGGEEKPFKTSDLKNRIDEKIYNKERLTQQEYDFAVTKGIPVPDESTPGGLMAKKEPTPKKKGWFEKLFDGKDKDKVSLPAGVRTTSEAVDHLIKTHNMTRNEAIQWLKTNMM